MAGPTRPTYVEPSWIDDAGDSWDRRTKDQSEFDKALDKAREIQVASVDTFAGYALQDLSKVIAATEDAIKVNRDVLATIAENLHDTATAYRNCEDNNTLHVNGIWSELGEMPPRLEDPQPGPYRTTTYDRTFPSSSLGEPNMDYKVADLVVKVTDLAHARSDTPPSLREEMEKFMFAQDIEPWLKRLDAKVEPIGKAASVWYQYVKGYEHVRNSGKNDRHVLLQHWEGPAADQTSQYLHRIENWYNQECIPRFLNVWRKWNAYATAIHIQAALAANDAAELTKKYKFFTAKYIAAGSPKELGPFFMEYAWQLTAYALSRNAWIRVAAQLWKMAVELWSYLTLVWGTADRTNSLHLTSPLHS